MANTNQPKGTGFVNLSRYLGANKNNNLGSAVAKNVSGRAGEVKSNLGQLQSNFTQSANDNALGTEANTQARTKALESIMGGNANVDQKTEQDFAKFRTGAYGGPTELDPTKSTQLSTQAGQLERDVKGLGTAQGRGNLLQQTVGKPSYSQGQKKLDTLLLGQQPTELNRTRRDVAGIAQGVQEARQGAQAMGKEQIARAQQFGQDTQRALKDSTGGVVSELEQRAITANQQRPEIYNSLVNAIKQGDITPEQAQMLGLQEGTQTYGVNFDPFVSQSQIAADKSNIAGETDKAKLSALAKLSGQAGVDAINTAAEAYRGPLNIRKEDLLKGINDRKATYEDLLNRSIFTPGSNSPLTALAEYETRKQPNESLEDYLNRSIQAKAGKPGEVYSENDGRGGTTTNTLTTLKSYFNRLQQEIEGQQKMRSDAQSAYEKLGNNYAASRGNEILYGKAALDHVLKGSLIREQNTKNELNTVQSPLNKVYNKVLK